MCVQRVHMCVQRVHMCVQRVHMCVQRVHMCVQRVHMCVHTAKPAWFTQYDTGWSISGFKNSGSICAVVQLSERS